MSDSVRTIARDSLQHSLTAVGSEGLLPEVPKQPLVKRSKRTNRRGCTTNTASALTKVAGRAPRVPSKTLAKLLRVAGRGLV